MMKANRFPQQRLVVGVTDSEQEGLSISLKGISDNTDYIIKLARKYNIPVVKSPRMAKLLHDLPEDALIPPDLIRPLEVILEGLE